MLLALRTGLNGHGQWSMVISSHVALPNHTVQHAGNCDTLYHIRRRLRWLFRCAITNLRHHMPMRFL